MDPVTLIAAIGGTGVLSGAGAAGVTAVVGGRLRRAQVRQITAEAHNQIYAAYGELIETLRAELADTRTELARARVDLAEARTELSELRARVERYEKREAELSGQITRYESVQEGEET